MQIKGGKNYLIKGPKVPYVSPVSPDVFVVEHADLVELSPTVGANHERLQLQKVILLLIKLLLFHETKRNTNFIIYHSRIPSSQP